MIVVYHKGLGTRQWFLNATTLYLSFPMHTSECVWIVPGTTMIDD